MSNKNDNNIEMDLNNFEFQNVKNLIDNTSSSVFMTGRAGTGKSTFLRYIVRHTHKKTVVLAPTGIAAVNVGGVTLHSFFKIPLHPIAPNDSNFDTPQKVKERQKFTNEKIKLLKEIELIIIDEISMVRADILDFIDKLLRIYVNPRIPFGGKQLLLVGDAFQLEPVVKNDEWDILRHFYKSPYFFGANVFTQIALVQIELKKVYRQHDREFLALLDRIRINASNITDLNTINSRYRPNESLNNDNMYITLCTRRDRADNINDEHLNNIDCEPTTFTGEIHGDFPLSSLPTLQELQLKPDAQIVFVKNDREKRWFNGTIARIISIEEDGVWVKTEDLNEYFVEPEEWDNIRYKWNDKEKKVTEEIIGSFTQLPIKLAWAITIHKSQGLTFDNVIIDIGRGAFACGQVYVALSRCRSLDGITLISPISQRDILTNNEVLLYAQTANDKLLIDKQLAEAEAKQLYKAAIISFRNKDMVHATEYALKAFALRPEDLSLPKVQRFISLKLNIINRLENELHELLRSREQSKEELIAFADEYYIMAVECKESYNDSVSAIANLNKAIQLIPNHIKALILRIKINTETGDYDTAFNDANLAINNSYAKNNKQATELLRLRATIHSKQRNYGNAYDDLRKALHILDDEPTTYHMLAYICKRLGEDDEAQAFRNIAEDLEDI